MSKLPCHRFVLPDGSEVRRMTALREPVLLVYTAVFRDGSEGRTVVLRAGSKIEKTVADMQTKRWHSEPRTLMFKDIKVLRPIPSPLPLTDKESQQ